MKQFQIRLLFSTDLTSRGIDAQNVDLIINLDVPWDPATYLHRIGRSGRFGSAGLSVTLAAEGDELNRLRNIIFKTNSDVVKLNPVQSWDEEFDLWECDRSDMELLEGLEKQEQENDVVNGLEIDNDSKNVGKKKIRGKKKKKEIFSSNHEEVTYVDITKAWVPVVPEEAKVSHSSNSILEDNLASENYEIGEEQKYGMAKNELENYFDDVNRHYQAVTKSKFELEDKKDIDELVDTFLSQGKLDLPVGAKEEEPLQIPEPNETIVEAASTVLVHEKLNFHVNHKKVLAKFAQMSNSEALEFLKSSKKFEEESAISEVSDNHVKTGAKPKISRTNIKIPLHDEIGSFHKMDMYNIENKKNELARGHDFKDTHEPSVGQTFPHPHRHIPVKIDLNDMSWLQIWISEVAEIREYIHDQELITEMGYQMK